jgi:type IV secretory pathway VirJ component
MNARRSVVGLVLLGFAALSAPAAAPGPPAGLPSQDVPPGIPSVAGLPLIEVPAADGARDLLAVLITGDGGWALPDRGLSRDLADAGVAVVGRNALKYFWKPKTPDGCAADLARILRHYLAVWHKTRTALIGYSLGADVLPFMMNRLPEDLQAGVVMIALLGPSSSADFEFHLSNWLGGGPGKNARPTIPEIEKLPPRVALLCAYGQGDDDQICTRLDPRRVRCLELPGGHRLKSGYGPVTAAILDSLKRP